MAASVKFLVPFAWLVSLGEQFERRAAPAIAQPAVSFVIDEVFAAAMTIMTVAAADAPAQTALLPWLLIGGWFAGFAAVLFCWWLQWAPIRSVLRRAVPTELGPDYETAGLVVMSSRSTFEPGVVGGE